MHYTIPAPVAAPQKQPLSDYDELQQMPMLPGLARRAFPSEDLKPVQQWSTARRGDSPHDLPQIYEEKFL